MRHHKGKSFLAPPRLFKGDKALYFPNLQGQTLVKGTDLRDTTAVLEGKVSVVNVFSSAWAEGQVASFTGEQKHPELHQVLNYNADVAQMVNINVEENAMKAALINLCMPSLRRRIAEEDWGRYFIVRRGLTHEIREMIGLLNSKVGYIYLVDEQCRIRWAASGIPEGDEKVGLIKGLRRLVEDAKTKKPVKA
jgi:ATPase complex subunit ATP10